MTKVQGRKPKTQAMTNTHWQTGVGSPGVRSSAWELVPRTLGLCAHFLAACVALCLLAALPLSAAAPRRAPPLSGMPIYFEANRGQIEEPVDFVARGRDHTIYLSAGGALVALREAGLSGDSIRHDPLRPGTEATVHFVRMSLRGGNSKAEVAGQEQFAGRVNYLIGNNPAAWRQGIPMFAKVCYAGVYPGVDVIYYGNDRQLEYDFIVAPGADPSAIALRFDGADRLEIDGTGDLVLHLGKGQLRHHKPIVYQTVKGVRREVAGSYRLKDRRTVVFALGTYDRREPLVIDPWLSYSTYLGGGRSDGAWAVAADAQGSAYIAGDTLSVFKKLPLSGEQTNYGGGTDFGGDAFAARLDYDGTNLLFGYLTYLGGNSLDGAMGLAIDGSGSAYITGYTLSTNFPVTGASLQARISGTNDPVFKTPPPDAFVTRLDTNGYAVYSTYLGGENAEVGTEIAVDTSGCAYITGYTESRIVYTTTNLVCTTTGGTNTVCVTNVVDVTVLVTNSIVTNVVSKKVSGSKVLVTNVVETTLVDFITNAFGFPTVQPIQFQNRGFADLFISKLDANGSNLLFSTYLGGGSRDFGTGIAVDPSGNVVVSGWSDSSNFPITNAVQSFNAGRRDAVITKLDATGTNLLYSTYLGGAQNDMGYRVAVDGAGAAYVTGPQASTDFPSTPGALNRGGLFASTNVGTSWALSSSGFTHGTVNAFVADPVNPGIFYAGTPRGVFKTVDGGVAWSAVNAGLFPRLVLSLAVDPSATDTIYAGTSAGLYVSTNAGLGWLPEGQITVTETNHTTTFFGLNPGLPSTAIRSIYVDPLVSTNVFVGTALGVYYRTASSNEVSDAAWFRLNSGLKNHSVFALAVHPVLPTTLFAATDGGIFVSTNRGTNWRSSSTGLVSKRSRALAIDPVTPSTLYAGTLSGFHKSTNSGTNWLVLTNGLGRPAINAVLIDPAQPSILYAGATNGLFKSVDGGNNWLASGTGLETANVSTIAFDPSASGALLAGTRSTNFAGGSNDVFLAKLAPGGLALEYALTFGGSRGDEGWGVAVDPSGSAFVTGFTLSKNFPVTNAMDLQTNYGGKSDAFVAQVDPGGTNLLFSIYLGGKRSDAGQGIALDGLGNVYVVGRTEASSFPITNAVQAKFGSGRNDAFVTRLMVNPSPLSIQTSFFGDEIVVSWLAVSSELVLETRELGGEQWLPIPQKPTLAAGRYSVRLPSASAGRLFRLRAGH